MSNDQPARRPPARSSGGGAPMGSTISIVIAIVAVVVGFIILRNINDTGDTGAGSSPPDVTTPSSTDDTTGDSTGGGSTSPTTTPIPVTPTTVPINKTAKVVVANASGIGGAAGAATLELQTLGFTTGTPTDAFGPQKVITKTIVYYQGGSEATAQSVAQLFSTPEAPVAAAPIQAPIPVVNATIGDATVLVMVGTDLANKPLPAIAAPSTGTVTTLAGATVITTVTTLTG